MKKIIALMLIFPILIMGCGREIVDVTSTPIVPTIPLPTMTATAIPEPTALPTVEPTAPSTIAAIAEPTSVPTVEAVEIDSADSDTEDMATVDAMDSAEKTYIVNPATSLLVWYGDKPIGTSHIGTIDLSGGELVIDNNTLLGGVFDIDMSTIKENEGETLLEEHLRSDDFFNTAVFPTARVTLLDVEAGNNVNVYNVRAELTIKDITNEITFPATVDITDSTFNGRATIDFDRSLWDIRYGSAAFFSGLGDALINDIITIKIAISGEVASESADSSTQSGN